MEKESGNKEPSIQRPWIALKFGGSSVATVKNWETISHILQQRLAAGERSVVVCSALAGTTDMLIGLCESAATGGELASGLHALKKRYFEIAEDMGLDAAYLLADELRDLENHLARIAERGHDSALQALVVSSGERMTTILGAAFLKRRDTPAEWLDARRYLKSDSRFETSQDSYFLSASCDYGPDRDLVDHLEDLDRDVVLTQGFVAGTARGETVLLGRGGSDTSAAYFAAKIGAKRLEIWTDVPGMFSANPRWVADARLIRKLHYEDAASLAAAGAKILHPRCVEPARSENIPIHIKSTQHPDLEGSVINGQMIAGTDPFVTAISSRTGLCMISAETTGDDSWVLESMPSFVGILRKHGLHPESMMVCDRKIRATVDTALTPLGDECALRLREAMTLFSVPGIDRDLASVSLCGQGLDRHFQEIGSACKVFDTNQIHYVNPTHDGRSLTFILGDEGETRGWVNDLHRELIGDSPTEHLGPTWQELQNAPPAKVSAAAMQPLNLAS